MKFPFYEQAPKEIVSACNLCGGSNLDSMRLRDRYGLTTTIATCQRCGLTFLSERMTPAAYREFYAGGHYRELLTLYRREVVSAKSIEADQKRYAKRLSKCLAPYMEPYRDGTLLDVGGSTGIVAERIALDYNLHATVVEPSESEAQRARDRGLTVAQVPIEEYDNAGNRFDLVLLCRSVDHLMDVTGTFRKIRQWVRDGGLFYVDITGNVPIKIDHPFYFTPKTLWKCLHRCGFKVKVIVRANGMDNGRVGMIAEAV